MLSLRSLVFAQSGINLAQANLEELLQTEVTSVSKKEQQLFQTPAAAYVLTGEDIRRSGVSTVPDALRLVPGLQVARIDANKWAISARGFNGLWANKLLVLVDGRVVYTPVSSGVYWDLQDVILEDIDRIEVIRGPGASMWGANAVNGVINIISKTAESTTGGLVSLSTGTGDRGIGSVRYGGRLASNGFYRLFLKQAAHGALVEDNGLDAGDNWRMTQAGFRVDLEWAAASSLTVQGSGLTGESGQRINPNLTSYVPTPLSIVEATSPAQAGNVLARWTRVASPDRTLSVQAFWDRSYRFVVGKGETTQTFDVELQQRQKAGRHDLVWGLGQRFWSDREEVKFSEYFDPSSSRTRLFNAFVHDEIAIAPRRVILTAGTKLEHNTVSGFEFQPTVRLTWLATTRQTAWTAISRAARTPSRVERALHVDYAAFPGEHGELVVLGIRGDPDLPNEHTTAYELGYRVNTRGGVLIDATAFYNVYDDLRTERRVVAFEPAPLPHVAIVRQYSSGMAGRSAGIELLAQWRPFPVWGVDAGYDWLQTRLTNAGDSPDGLALINRNPAHQVRLKSQLNLRRGWQFDATALHVGRLQSVDVAAYTRVDIRLGGPVAPGLSLDLVGRDLLQASHWEFDGFEGVYRGQAEREWSLKLKWTF